MVIFSITFLPFNALHHHDEDEHIIAVLSHDAAHHCELDEYACQGEYAADGCEHETHVGKSLTKCFSCQFHFIKVFAKSELHYSLSSSLINRITTFLASQQLQQSLELLANKGPPAHI